jgi:hypothetical protein
VLVPQDPVQSDWFRHARQALVRSVSANGSLDWASPADAGWHAAEVVQAPVSDGVTAAGLPRRLPQANLVPGTVGGPGASEPAPATVPQVRSAAETRERFASFQRGVRTGRAAAHEARPDTGEDGRVR